MKNTTRRKAIAGLGGIATLSLAGSTNAAENDEDVLEQRNSPLGGKDITIRKGEDADRGQSDESVPVHDLQLEAAGDDWNTATLSGTLENNTGADQETILLNAFLHEGREMVGPNEYIYLEDIPAGAVVDFEVRYDPSFDSDSAIARGWAERVFATYRDHSEPIRERTDP